MSNTIQNVEIVFATVLRVPKEQRSESLYYYDIRHDDDCQGIPCELANYILVNHLCTIATKQELKIGAHGYILSEEEQNAVENALYKS